MNEKVIFELENGIMTIGNSTRRFKIANVESAERVDVDAPKSRSLPYTEINAIKKSGAKVSYQLWDNVPLMRIIGNGANPLFALSGEHWIIRAVKLNAFTDEVDTLTDTQQRTLLFGGIQGKLEGDIFFFEDVVSGSAYIAISETPDHVRGAIEIVEHRDGKPSPVVLRNGGYPVVIGLCKRGQCEELCRAYFRHANNCTGLVTMSNTWGDCNSATRVCEEFIQKEIEAAAQVGLDIVQIDDGWQAGNTLYTIGRDEKGNRVFDDSC